MELVYLPNLKTCEHCGQSGSYWAGFHQPNGTYRYLCDSCVYRGIKVALAQDIDFTKKPVVLVPRADIELYLAYLLKRGIIPRDIEDLSHIRYACFQGWIFIAPEDREHLPVGYTVAGTMADWENSSDCGDLVRAKRFAMIKEEMTAN